MTINFKCSLHLINSGFGKLLRRAEYSVFSLIIHGLHYLGLYVYFKSVRIIDRTVPSESDVVCTYRGLEKALKGITKTYNNANRNN